MVKKKKRDYSMYTCVHCGATPYSEECKHLHKIEHRFLDACRKLEFDGVRIVELLQKLIQDIAAGKPSAPLTKEEIEYGKRLAKEISEEMEKGDADNDKKRSDS